MFTSSKINHNPELLLQLHPTTKKVVFIFCVAFCLSPFAGPAMALFLGIAVAQLTGHPYLHLNHKATHVLLQFSVVGLGFGMNLHSAMAAGSQGMVITIASIAGTLLLGSMLGRFFKTEGKTSHLIACGTAICGGSAIAAVSPVIKAHEKQISVALGAVFILNSVALFVFPAVGHWLHLSQTQFGLWCALAIHDTSSVVGAAAKFGGHALEVATTVKLARALYIIPVTFISARLFKGDSKKAGLPWFILLFILALVANTYVPAANQLGRVVVPIAKAGLTLTLFLIGAGLSRSVVTAVGFRPMLQALLLWVAIAGASLFAITQCI